MRLPCHEMWIALKIRELSVKGKIGSGEIVRG